MADTNDLRVIVSLDVGKSSIEIEKDLPILEKLLASKDSGKLKIVGQLDTTSTEKNINQQLSKLKIDNTALKITPQLNISSNNNIGEQISKQVENSTKNVDFSAIAKNLRKAFNINDNASIKEATENIKAMYEAFNVDPAKYKDAFNKLISWYEQRSNDLIYSERQKVYELNNLLLELYNQPELHTTFPKLTKHSKNDPLVVTKGTLEEMKSLLGSTKEVYKLFGSIRVDNKHGALLGSFGEDWDPKEYNDSLAVYVKYLQEIQRLRKTNRLQLSDTASKEENELYFKMIEKTILKQLGLINTNNQVVQSNQRVAESERQIAQAQQQVNSISINADNVDGIQSLERKKQLTDELAVSEEKISVLNKQLQADEKQLAVIREQLNDAFLFGDDKEYDALYKQERSIVQRNNATKQMLDQENATAENIRNQLSSISANIQQEQQQLNKTAQTIAHSTANNSAGTGASANYFSNNAKNILAVANSAKEAEKYYKNLLVTMGDTKGVVTSTEHLRGAEGELKSFTIAVKSGSGAFEAFNYSINKEGTFDIGSITAANAGIQRLTESTQKYYASMEATIITAQASAQKLKATWSDTNGGKSVKDAEHLDSLKQKYAELMAMIEGLRGQSELEAKQTIADIKAKEKEINSLIGTYHNAEKVATDLRTKGYETVKEITGTKINTFEEKIKGALGSTEQLSAEMTNLRTKFESLNSVTTQAEKSTILTSILDDLDKAKAKLENLKEVKKNFDDASKSVNKVITDLNTMSRTPIFTTHSNNAGVIEFQDKIKGLSDTAKQVKADLNALGDSKAIPPELKVRVEELKKKFDELNGSNKTLQANLRQNDGWERTERQIQTLTARIKEYMAVNTKAAKKYSGQFDGLLSGLSQAEINKDSEAVRRLSADFQILRSNIKAAGDQGKTLWQSFIDGAKRFTMWFSITANIARAIRSIRQMISTVRELNTAMTAVIRVTQGTDAAYKQFFENAIASAKELKMNLVDLISQSAEWAKRGYNLSEVPTLAKASGIYSVVADIDNATAVQHLTTVLKTYNLTADDAIEVTSKLDNIANRYAVTAGDLGEILAHSISAMQVSHNTLDQTIAMGTAIAQITGNANEAGSTLKVLSMRLRGASTELINAGEDTEGMAESTSKLREKIMALTNVNGKGGFDIMLDNDTFKSTYEIMEGISKVWKDISDVNQANKICLYVQKCA